MEQIRDFFSESEIRHILEIMYEKKLKLIHYLINTDIDMTFYDTGVIKYKKGNKSQIFNCYIPIYNNIDANKDIIDNIIESLYKKYNNSNRSNSDNGFKYEIVFNMKDFKYKKKEVNDNSMKL